MSKCFEACGEEKSAAEKTVYGDFAFNKKKKKKKKKKAQGKKQWSLIFNKKTLK